MTELQDLVAAGYRLFAARTPPSDLAVCTDCCMDPRLERQILAREPKAIPLDEMREWYEAAFGARKEREVVRWLLPRILDLLAGGHEVTYQGNELVLKRLRLTGFPDDWDDAEVDHIECTAAALATALITSPEAFPGFELLDDFLSMAAQGGLRLPPLLVRIDSGPDAGLADLLAPSGDYPLIGWTPFWEDVPGLDVVLAWYARPELAERMIALGENPAADPRTRDRAWRVAEDILARL